MLICFVLIFTVSVATDVKVFVYGSDSHRKYLHDTHWLLRCVLWESHPQHAAANLSATAPNLLL